MTAKACVADDIRAYFAQLGARFVGVPELASQLHYLPDDIYAALTYLRTRGEAIYDQHKGWSGLPLWELKIRNKMLGAMK